MSEHFHVEKPFLDQLAALEWKVIDQGHCLIPCDPAASLRTSCREWLLPDVFRTAVLEISGPIFGSQVWTRKNTLMAKTGTNGLLNSPRYK